MKSLKRNIVENSFSKIELRHAVTLNKILREDKIHKSQWNNISELFILLSMRTKNILSGFSEAFDCLKDEALQESVEPNSIDKRIRKDLMKEFKKRYNRFPTSNELQKLRPHLVKGREELRNDVVTAANNWDINNQLKHGLFNNFAEFSKFKTTRFGTYHWAIHNTEDSLTLGDLCTLAYLDSNQKYEPAIFVDNSNINHVLLPIAPQTLIYGYDTQLTQKPNLPSNEVINRNMAELSREFIVAKSEHDFPNDLLNLIGSRAEFTKEKFG